MLNTGYDEICEVQYKLVPPGELTHKKDGLAHCTFKWLKKTQVLVALRVFSLKRS